ncbi:MAG: hypothetical protein QG656_637, partial [Candidatus Hydrogenedentes bacterium]|nr:hypothetical protein [Candidatus Hydrogenedentota bacterium]
LHTFALPGSYTVTLTVTSDDGTDAESVVIVVSGAGPNAAFTANPLSGPAPLTVSFTDTSVAGTAAIASWAWTFGDGGTGTGPNPSHTYAAAGSYTVTLTVTAADGVDSASQTVTVTVPGVGPDAAFNADRLIGPAPLTVWFTDASVAGTSAITAWAWVFGDGGTSGDQDPSHTYAAQGIYTVTLTVTTPDGVDSASRTVTVTDPGAAGPDAKFTANAFSGYAPLILHFTDQSLPGTSPIASWAWDFGDGGSSTDQHPTYTYENGGNFTVRLTVTTADGQDWVAQTVVIYPANGLPTPDFSATPLVGDMPLTVQFTNLTRPGSSAVTGYYWLFGDGQPSTEENPSHAFGYPGKYTISLSATNAVGERTEIKRDYITVEFGPVPDHLSQVMMPVVGGEFTMGKSDAEIGYADELPNQTITLTDYRIGRYEVTNEEYAAALNWALDNGYPLATYIGEPFAPGSDLASGDVYYNGVLLLPYIDSASWINFWEEDGLFYVELLGAERAWDEHPVVSVTWYGAAMFCNWLSESEGLTPCYDTQTWEVNPAKGGYYLPSEAQWERAAGWDPLTQTHNVFSFGGDPLDYDRANYENHDPISIAYRPATSPVGWFNGTNMVRGLYGQVQSKDSYSPCGCYDMSGNVWEWCHDWYALYGSTGTKAGNRVVRGGAYTSWYEDCRSAKRGQLAPDQRSSDVGFRVARDDH